MTPYPLPADEDERIRLLHDLRILDTAPEPAFDAIARLAAGHAGSASGALMLVDRDRVWCKAAAGQVVLNAPRDASLCARAIAGSGVMLVEDTHADPGLVDHPSVIGAPHVRFYASAVVEVEGHALGTVCCIDTEPRRVAAAALGAIRDLASVASAMLTSRLNEGRARLREARVRTASRAASDWLWETDADGMLTWLTDNALDHEGSNPRLAVGEPWLGSYRELASLRPDDWARCVDAFARQRPFSDVLTVCRGWEGPVTVASNGKPVFDSAGRFKGFRGASRDVTVELHLREAAAGALAQRQSELVDSQGRLSAILGAIPDLWFVMDEHGRFLESNVPDHPALPRPFDDMRGRTVRELLPSPVASICERALALTLASGQPQVAEYELHLPHGQLETFESRWSAMPGRRVLHLARVVTELRTLERDRLVLERAIEAEGAMPIAVLVADGDRLPVTFVNRAFERLSGYARAEVIGRDLRDLQRNLKYQAGLAVLRDAALRGVTCTVQITSPRKDGSLFINELNMAPAHDAQGRLTHYVCVLHDVTERTHEAEKLRISEELYRSVASTISDGLLVVMAEGTISKATPAACAILDIDANELVGSGRPWIFELRGADGEPLAAGTHPLEQALATGASVEHRLFTLHRRDGSTRWLDLSCHPLRITDDATALPVLAAFRDITAQHMAEQALAKAEERWKFALEGAGQAVWDWDARANSLFLSDASQQLLGYEPDAAGPTFGQWMDRVHPDDAIDARARLNAHLRGETAQFLVEHRMRHQDGSDVWVMNRAKVVSRQPNGRAERMVGTLIDVTARRDAEDVLRDKQAAELASRAKTEFLSRMSHEMRTPLNAVIGFSQLLLSQPDAPDARRVHDYAEHVLRAGEHLLALINDVLDLQRVEEGRIVPDWQDVSLQAISSRVNDLLSAAARLRHVTLISRIPPGLAARADERLLRQVLINIASNAIKYNRSAGTVTWSAEIAATGRVALHIDDTGGGLTPQQLTRLFEPFERLGRETSSVEGTGLGLIIARRLCLAMGGSLDITSRNDVGTRATVTLPAAEAISIGAAPPPAPLDRSAEVVADALPLRMLYVEDNRINAILFEAAFAGQGGYELRLAEDSDEALEQLRDWRPDVLVLDAHLPGMDGFELLQLLRRSPGLADVPAFMCSADAMPEDLRRAAQAGFRGYWSKPINLAKIISDLAEIGSARRRARP